MQNTIHSIAVIEDNVSLSDFLRDEIQAYFADAKVYAFYNGEDALQFLSSSPVDIAVFDITLPGISGVDCIRTLKTQHPSMQMVVFTVLENSENVFDALKAGAVGYLLKTTPTSEIIEAIEEVNRGGSPMTSSIARKVTAAFHNYHEPVNTHFENLSRREKEILEYLEKGSRYKEIADNLYISLETVRTHIRNIYDKLQVNSRIEALRKTGRI
jgi:DNA-binding NarL/FixJ family response regulator